MEAYESITNPFKRVPEFCCGTWGGEFHPEFGPREGDVIVLEHWAQSGFANTDLDSQLKQRGIQKIILVGNDSEHLYRSHSSPWHGAWLPC